LKGIFERGLPEKDGIPFPWLDGKQCKKNCPQGHEEKSSKPRSNALSDNQKPVGIKNPLGMEASFNKEGTSFLRGSKRSLSFLRQPGYQGFRLIRGFASPPHSGFALIGKWFL